MAARTSSSMTNTVGAPAGVFMCVDVGGQSKVKTCAARRVVGSPQAAAMRFNDGSADPKPHAGAVLFGRKEGLKDLIRLLRGQPRAGIADRHQDLPVFGSLRLDD